MTGGRYRILPASEAATQPIPQYISLNYENLFKIQRVNNPFPLRPVSFSRLSSYLECPSCALEQQRKRRKKEPRHFTDVHQGSLFAARQPDPRLTGTLLHAIVDLLHDPNGPIDAEQQASLLVYPDVLTRFIRNDLLKVLQDTGKLRLAMFYDEITSHNQTLYTHLLDPILSYQRELKRTNGTVYTAAERFQFKLLSTRRTFPGHSDWGGYVGIVGEFDQIRLRASEETQARPAIMEFKKGLGKKRSWDKWLDVPDAEAIEVAHQVSDDLIEPGMAHALQLMVYWLAFQTRWDIMARIQAARGQTEELEMSFQQDLDLIIYNLHDGSQYLLEPTNFQAALVDVINCIFHLNWAMKSGYALQSPEHNCGKTQLVDEVPSPLIQVGYDTLPAGQCYKLAQKSFNHFCTLVHWRMLT